MLNTQFLNQTFNVKVWDGETLGKTIALDTETTITSFDKTPDLVTFQAFDGGNCVYYVRREDVSKFLQHHSLASFVAHNWAFDHDVICKHLDNPHLFNTYYDNDKLFDTAILFDDFLDQ